MPASIGPLGVAEQAADGVLEEGGSPLENGLVTPLSLSLAVDLEEFHPGPRISRGRSTDPSGLPHLGAVEPEALLTVEVTVPDGGGLPSPEPHCPRQGRRRRDRPIVRLGGRIPDVHKGSRRHVRLWAWAAPRLGNAPVEGRHNPGDQSQILCCADGGSQSAQPGCRLAVGCMLRHAEGEDFRHGPGRDAGFELRQLVNSRPIPLPCALHPRMHARHSWVGPLLRLRQPFPGGRQACKTGNKPGRNLRGNRCGHRPRAEGRPPTALLTPSRVVQSGPVWALEVPVLGGTGLRAAGLASAAFPRRKGRTRGLSAPRY